jgi:hypothetical protein
LSQRTKEHVPADFAGALRYVKTLQAERRRIRQLLGWYEKECRKLDGQRIALARLAAEGPCFNSPLIVYEAKQLRDQILREKCRLSPEGKPL